MVISCWISGARRGTSVGSSSSNEFGSATTSISVGASRLESAVQPAGGTLRCAASYDQAFAPLGAGCLP